MLRLLAELNEERIRFGVTALSSPRVDAAATAAICAERFTAPECGEPACLTVEPQALRRLVHTSMVAQAGGAGLLLHVFTEKECPHARAWRARDRGCQPDTGGVPARGGHSLPRHSIASITPVRRHEPPCCVRYFDTSVATSLAAPQREEPTRTVRPHTEVADACASCAARILATSSRVKCSTVAMAGKSA